MNMPEFKRRASSFPFQEKNKEAQKASSHRDLIVWQRAVQLVSETYRFSHRFPADERFGLTAQMRRAAVSVPSNIAEGRSRSTRNDFIHFLHIALGSLAELETQFDIARNLGFGDEKEYSTCMQFLNEVRRMLVSMIVKLKSNTTSSKLQA